MHGNRSGSSGVNGTHRTELGNVDHIIRQLKRLFGQSRAFRAKQHKASLREAIRFHRHRTRNDVKRNHPRSLQLSNALIDRRQLRHIGQLVPIFSPTCGWNIH